MQSFLIAIAALLLTVAVSSQAANLYKANDQAKSKVGYSAMATTLVYDDEPAYEEEEEDSYATKAPAYKVTKGKVYRAATTKRTYKAPKYTTAAYVAEEEEAYATTKKQYVKYQKASTTPAYAEKEEEVYVTTKKPYAKYPKATTAAYEEEEEEVYTTTKKPYVKHAVKKLTTPVYAEEEVEEVYATTKKPYVKYAAKVTDSAYEEDNYATTKKPYVKYRKATTQAYPAQEEEPEEYAAKPAYEKRGDKKPALIIEIIAFNPKKNKVY